MSFPWLSVTAALPIVAAVVLALMPRRAGLAARVALGASLVAFAVGLSGALAHYDPDGSGYQLEEKHEWITSLGAWYSLGVDGIGLTLVLLTLVLTPIVIVASWHDGDQGRWSPNAFFAWVLALEGLAVGVFAATDVFLFYVLFEATLIPIYFLIGGFGGARRSYAAVKFLLFSLLGGLLMLASVVGLYVVANDNGGPTYLLAELSELPMDETTGRWLFLGFFARLRHQGADVPRAHLAARRRRGGNARHVGAAGEHPGQDRHLRHDPLLPRAVPRGIGVGVSRS